MRSQMILGAFFVVFIIAVIVLKAAALILALTGTIVSYYLAYQSEHLMAFSLLLPLVINAGFLSSALSVSDLRRRLGAHIIRSAKMLKQHLTTIRSSIDQEGPSLRMAFRDG